MEPATVTATPVPAVTATDVEVCGNAAQFRYVTEDAAATGALAWVGEAAASSRLHGGAVFAIDIETTSLRPADGRIRLVQIAAGNRCAVLDAFAFDPWAKIRGHAARPETLWTAHNAQFEQSWLGHHAGFTLLPMFDTRWVHVRNRALRTGLIAPGGSSLAAVCEQLLEFPLSKAERLSDWSAPRLSEAQLRYAALDALVLIELRSLLEREVIGGGRRHDIAVSLRRAELDARRYGRPSR
ncbi:MAG: hypothetical protein WAP37_04080 [Solirubrobacterales bacterium]